MNSPKKLRKFRRIDAVLLCLALSGIAGCGVKGDPLPPLRPTELGRGRPTYKRATEKIEIKEKVGESAKPLPSLNNKVRREGEEDDE